MRTAVRELSSHPTPGAVGLICESCGRRVRSTHAYCAGDPRVTCIIYGCGDLMAVERLEETHGGGHMAWRAYCKEHK